MLDLTVRLQKETDAYPAAREACAKLSQKDLALLIGFAQALCVAYEQLDPNRLIVVESREIVRP